MTDKKILDEQDLEKVTGGSDHTVTKMPTNFYNPIDKYDVENHRGENLYFVKGDTFVYGTVTESKEKFTFMPVTTRKQYVIVIATNKPEEYIIGREVKLNGDFFQAYQNAE